MTTLDITRSIDIKASTAKVWAALYRTRADRPMVRRHSRIRCGARWGRRIRLEGTRHLPGAHRACRQPETLVYRWAREIDADPVPGTHGGAVRPG